MGLFEKLFSPFGRLSRGGMWFWGVLVLGGLFLIAIIADLIIFEIDIREISMDDDVSVFYTKKGFSYWLGWVAFWPSIALSIKRFHDLGISGWVYVLTYVLILISTEMMYLNSADGLSPITLAIFSVFNIDLAALGAFVDDLPEWFFAVSLFLSLIVSFALTVVTLFIAGNTGPNLYGADPLGDDDETRTSADHDETPPWVNV